jgi:SAM-dependent methyltransferase
MRAPGIVRGFFCACAIQRDRSPRKFVHAAEDYVDAVRFDAVIGRYVLIHQSDPVGFLRAATHLLRPGGILALHEIEFGRLGSVPSIEIWDKAARAIVEFFRRTLPHHDVANRLIDLFAKLDCPAPKCFVRSQLVAVQRPQSTPGSPRAFAVSYRNSPRWVCRRAT